MTHIPKHYIDRDSVARALSTVFSDTEHGDPHFINGIITATDFILDYPTEDVVSRGEYESLLKRFKHLVQSKFISSFDEWDEKKHDYKRDIKEADNIKEVRHGEWVTRSICCFDWTVCSVCGASFNPDNWENVWKQLYGNPAYCPLCGAKMDGGEEQ